MVDVVREQLVHDGPGGRFEGVVVRPTEASGNRPSVLVIPNILGQKESDTLAAEGLARLGYVAFACDLFGQGRRKTHESPARSEYMDELNADRLLLRDRLASSLAALRGQRGVDGERLAAIGFCFGGQCVLDMARSGQPIVAGVSFHGIYTPPPYPVLSPMRTKLLMCHGWDDPLAPPAALQGLAAELTAAQADWQVHAYGHAGHAFTDRSLEGRSPPSGFGYDPAAARRSWAAMAAFLTEAFA